MQHKLLRYKVKGLNPTCKKIVIEIWREAPNFDKIFPKKLHIRIQDHVKITDENLKLCQLLIDRGVEYSVAC